MNARLFLEPGVDTNSAARRVPNANVKVAGLNLDRLDKRRRYNACEAEYMRHSRNRMLVDENTRGRRVSRLG